MQFNIFADAVHCRYLLLRKSASLRCSFLYPVMLLNCCHPLKRNYYYQLFKNSFSCLLLVPLIFHFPDASSKLKGPGVPLTFVRTIHCYSSLQLQRRLQTFTISGLCTFYLLCIYYFYSLTKNP